MNRLDKEFNRIVQESIIALLHKSVSDYEQTKILLLSRQEQDKDINDYLRKLFIFTDRYRPLLIEMKEGAA